MAQASLDDEDAWKDDFQTPHTLVHCVVQWDGGGHRELATGRTEASRGSPSWQPCYQVDIGEEEVTLESIDPTWRATRWLQLVVQGITEDEVPWYELVIPLTSGVEGTALSLAKCLLMAWRWSIKVRGEDVCLPTPTVLNIGQFMTKEEGVEGVGEPHWFMANSCTLQQVGGAAGRQKWEWPANEALDMKVSPLVRAFWEETGVDLTMACVKLCWEPTPRAIFHKMEEGPVAHIITFLDELAVWVPSLDTWEQLVWLPTAAIPHALTEAKLYGYCCDQVVDLGTVILVAQFRVTDEAGTYLCIARALVFGGSILAYNPAKNQAEWVPVHGLTNNLTWAEERSAIALANYVPHIPDEVAEIARLGAHQLVSWPNDSSTSEEEEDAWDPEPLTMDTEEWREESGDGARQTDLKERVEPDRWQHSWNWEAVMEGLQGLAYDDPLSNAMMMGADCPWGSTSSPPTWGPVTPHMLGSPMDQLLPM